MVGAYINGCGTSSVRQFVQLPFFRRIIVVVRVCEYIGLAPCNILVDRRIIHACSHFLSSFLPSLVSLSIGIQSEDVPLSAIPPGNWTSVVSRKSRRWLIVQARKM